MTKNFFTVVTFLVGTDCLELEDIREAIWSWIAEVELCT
jgi:hypothetical protein